MNLIHKLFFRRFTADEYNRLVEIDKNEIKSLRKRPQFIAGIILWAGLMFYFSLRALTSGKFVVPEAGQIAAMAVGLPVSLLVGWLLLKYVFRAPAKNILIFLAVVMFFVLFLNTQPRGFNLEYMICFIVSLLAFVFINDSHREHLAERLLKEQNK